ncbi:preprotein translocase subunit SecG [Marivirga sp. S37H4]|uniref:Protein-export membrane protein SecG n=1 Tax=Marivirga aurantiaca TaxID=2802615 RepID=A0A935CCR9_9BACT|nr:preprotein translocase subunit SecG [Marivirga aurantiaca]MBK6266248.1 preprotein translocase subunit SecG [Marivirga aurantiaca]
MLTIIITLIILVSILLVLVVLAQNSKGGGLTSQFGGSGATQIVGVKRTGDILEKITWVLAISLMLLALTSSIVIKSDRGGSGYTSPNLEKVQDGNQLPGLEQNQQLLPQDEQTAPDEQVIEGLQEEENDTVEN